MYHKVPVTIEVEQFKKLLKGRPVQLKPHQLQPSHKHHVMVHPLMGAKMHKARLAGKGVRLEMTPHEIEMTGEGWGDLWNSIKSGVSSAWNWGRENIPAAAKWVKDNVIDTPFYQEKVRPKIREKLEGFAESKPYAGYTIPAIEYLGDETGAFGMKGKKHAKPRAKPCAKRITGASFRN